MDTNVSEEHGAAIFGVDFEDEDSMFLQNTGVNLEGYMVLTCCLISDLWGRIVSFIKYVHFVSCMSLNSAFKNGKLSLSNKENSLISWFIPISLNP